MRTKKYIGEVTYEVCEGLHNGLDDFRAASIASMQSMFTRYMGEEAAGLSGFFTQVYGGTFWNLIQGCYEFHAHSLQSEGNAMDEEVSGSRTQAMLSELDALNTEAEVTTLKTRPFSDAYKKGSINK